MLGSEGTRGTRDVFVALLVDITTCVLDTSCVPKNACLRNTDCPSGQSCSAGACMLPPPARDGSPAPTSAQSAPDAAPPVVVLDASSTVVLDASGS